MDKHCDPAQLSVWMKFSLGSLYQSVTSSETFYSTLFPVSRQHAHSERLQRILPEKKKIQKKKKPLSLVNQGKFCVCMCQCFLSSWKWVLWTFIARCKVNSVSLNMIVTEISASLVFNAVHSHSDNNKQCVVWEHTNVWFGNSNEASAGL